MSDEHRHRRKENRVEVYERGDGRFEWRRRNTGNWEVVATSGGQGYETRAGANEAAERENPGTEIVQVEPDEGDGEGDLG